MYIYINVYIYVYIYIHIYMYMYIYMFLTLLAAPCWAAMATEVRRQQPLPARDPGTCCNRCKVMKHVKLYSNYVWF